MQDCSHSATGAAEKCAEWNISLNSHMYAKKEEGNESGRLVIQKETHENLEHTVKSEQIQQQTTELKCLNFLKST